MPQQKRNLCLKRKKIKMKDKSNIVLCFIGGIAVVWLALLVAPYVEGGLFEIIEKLPQKMNTPFDIEICENSLKTVLIFLLAYGLGIGIYLSTRKNYRRGKEYGSAVWGVAHQISKKYMQQTKNQNKILTQNVQIGLQAQKHRRNLNTLVVGGSRCRQNKIFCKTEYYAM